MKPSFLKKSKTGSLRLVKNQTLYDYSLFDQIDGNHSFKEAVPNGYVDYRVRSRKGGGVFYFNFKLAKEMGLIPLDHEEHLTPELNEKLLSTFSIVIINEYDIENEIKYPEHEIKPNAYMATRYLQLQHPNKKGTTSGDGRGIWNGEVSHQGVTWDISSSGTGATRLSPAYAQTKKFVKTGDKNVCYGNGYNELCDGLGAAICSAVFHDRGIETERTLALISFEDGTSINVRASKNLLRPAHFFHFLKQGDLEGLKAVVNYFIDRQIKNGEFQDLVRLSAKLRYEKFVEKMASIFSQIVATYEAEYIFCWLDWDGDNILANGGIIDYGSIRQFGLYHKEYRYDDVTRFSTNIPEQKKKARYIVQTFAQMRNFLITGKKQRIEKFKNDRIINLFQNNFKKVLYQNLLKKIGLSDLQAEFLLNEHLNIVKKFKKSHEFFEKVQSYRKKYKISDGITRDAVFCMRTLHRELPQKIRNQEKGLSPSTFIELIQSSYAKKKDLRLSRKRILHAHALQKNYVKLLKLVSKKFHQGDLNKTFLEVMMRASVANPLERITGDGVLHLTASLIRNKRKLSFDQMNLAIQALVKQQLDKNALEENLRSMTEVEVVEKIVERNFKAIHRYRHGY